ncbi:hypothetical protein MKX03_027196 [Papaver bracteatum]|nr:hypothetical protein MKX03_027196 [Papaver bracteatum]
MGTRETMNMKEKVEGEEEEEEGEKICRICHSLGDSGNPLQYPCACSGSIKFVHPKCLLHWMKQRNTFECEVCKHTWSVCRVYAENTPKRLPLRELMGGISLKACLVLRFCVRFCFSFFHQNLMVPFLAFWTWRLSLVRSLSEAKELLVHSHSHMSPSTAMMDWLYGIIICNVLHMMWLCGVALIRKDEDEEDGELLAARRLWYFHRLMIISFRLDVPLRSTGIYMFMSIRYFLKTNLVLIRVPFYFGLLTMDCLPEALSSVGKPLLVYPSSGLYFVITLATGYMVVAPLVFVYLGIPIRTVASKIRHYLRKFLTTMINPFVLIIHLGVIPSAYGWWLDVCTITMLGKSISDRVDFFSKFPLLSSSMHWMVGIIYMCQINISISQVRRVLRRGVLYFLHDLADPIEIILGVLIDEVQVSQLFSIAVNGILIVFLVYFPGVLAMGLAPTIFPLHISVPDPFTEIPVAMVLLQICFPYAIELWGTVEALLHQWITTVCCFLGLTCLLSSRPEDIGGQENVRVERQQDRLRDGIVAGQDPNKNIFTSQNFDGVENYNGFTFVHRVVLLVVLAWITLLLFNSSMIIVSLQLGRAVFSFISNLPITRDIKCNDLYAFFIGNFCIWTCFTGARYFIEHFKAGKAHLRFSDICKLLCLIAESCVLSSLWIIVIPVLIGLLFEFCFMLPVRASVVEAPVLLLRQNWAVGFFLFKLWRTLVLLNHRIVLVDDIWRIKFERVRDNGFLKLPGKWVLQELLIPIIMNLSMSLCFPYVFARWVVPSLGYSQIVNSTLYRFSWLAYVTIIVLFSCAKIFPVWIINLHNSIRDDRYSGLGLQNFGEAAS